MIYSEIDYCKWVEILGRGVLLEDVGYEKSFRIYFVFN